MESTGGQAFKRPRQHPDDVEALAERDDVHVLANRCPFCHVDIQVDTERWTACARCMARHHDPCWVESGACGSCGGTQRLAPVREAVGLGAAQREIPASLGTRLSAWASRNTLWLLLLAMLPVLAVLTTLLLSGVEVGTVALIGLIGVVALTVVFGPAAAILIYAYRKARKRKQAQREATQASQQAREGWQSYPVRYCSEERFRSWWKLFPWEATGVLSLSDQGVTLTTKTLGGTIERRFHPQDATVEWEGQNWWPNGALSWFVIKQDGLKLYFTSETGGTVFGSERSTREIYERLLAR